MNNYYCPYCGQPVEVLDTPLGAQLAAALADMVRQHCYEPDDKAGCYCAGALSANADAMYLLVELGLAEIVDDTSGRMVTIRFKEPKQ